MKHRPSSGFTLIELLVVISVIALLIGILLPALGAARRQARAITCLAQMRTLGQTLTLYLQDNDDCFPNSNHAGFGTEPSWDVQFSRYLGAEGVYRAVVGGDFYLYDNPDVAVYYNTSLRCPEDLDTDIFTFSYGQNVYFNLDPKASSEEQLALDGRLWWRSAWLPAPSSTVIYGEAEGSENHIMAHFWKIYTAPSTVAQRHDDTANFVFADGHAARSRALDQFDLATDLDRWNPATAR